MREAGVYTCTVSNNRSSDTRRLTVVAANPPTNFTVLQAGPASIRVFWTAPASGATVIGYRIFYTDGNITNNVGAGANETDYTITIPQPQSGLTYSFAIVALSSHLPSTVVGPTIVTVATLGTVTPTSVVVSWSQQPSVDSYEISFQRATGNQQLGDCSSFQHSGSVPVSGTITTHTLTDLQEFSTYLITVTAVSVAGRAGSSPLTVNTQMAAPSGSPQSLREVETTSTSITIAWDAVNCIDRNSNITGYVVRYTSPSTCGTDSVMVAGTGDAGGMVTIDGLAPSTQYSIQVAAVNSNGDVGYLSTALSVQTAPQALGSGSLVGVVVGACIGTALLYTVVLLVVKYAVVLWNKRHSTDIAVKECVAYEGVADIEVKECVAYGGVADIAVTECVAYGGVAVHSGVEGSIYENPQ